ncbi:hypothetical protein HPB49_022369 [Dermacentor silvarum]|uniref:Uncharacterized protein n=1 Tax=Dermacentor silvarum TaxID=543639 RepID=A0ACB8E3K8_DERSI|nr:hypothetical protein HPB49_022369 [Dermacentor silvarum]
MLASLMRVVSLKSAWLVERCSRFWSHAMYDNGFHQLLESYLRLAPRYTGLHRYTITKEMQEADERVHKLVFRTYLRLSTNKESKVNFMDKDKFADLIYENFVFDIAKLIDICVLFERGNHDLVCRMVEHIMKCQPKYNSDLKEIENTIFLAFDMAAQSIQSQDDKDSEAKPRRLDEGKAESSELCLMPFQKFLDCITQEKQKQAGKEIPYIESFFEVICNCLTEKHEM